MASNYSFIEKQKFNQNWIKIILTVVLVVFTFISIMVYIFVEKSFITVLPFLVALFIYIIFRMITLEIKINEFEINCRFFPFQFKDTVIFKSNIDSVDVTKYEPLREYGGWGIRISNKGKAFTVSGNYGIRITLKNKREILIGTQHPVEVLNTLERLGYNTNKDSFLFK